MAASGKLLITSHINPDGDAIGSQLALYGALIGLGKQVIIINTSPLPEVYRFLPHAKAIKHSTKVSGDFDLAFVLDCADLSRVGEWAVNSRTIVNVDHHHKGELFGDLNWCREEACSASELIYELIKALGIRPDVSMATNIYAGILTDTGSFHFDNTSSQSLMLAGQLVELGVNPRYVAQQLYETLPRSTITLLGYGLEGLELSGEEQIASLTITREILQKSEAKPWETENFIDLPKSIKGVRVALLFQQTEDDYFKVSLRSKGEINVAQIAKGFGGGGHYHAAGCRIRGSLPEIKRQMIESVQNYLANL